MNLTKMSSLTHKLHTMSLPITADEFFEGQYRRGLGALIQDAFPTLSEDQREFILTGITPEEWDAEFGEHALIDE